MTLADRRPRPEYLELIEQVDIALDPFPFNGHTTTCDALWQGVPVVTLAGHNYVSRFGSSALVSLGLEELIANSTEEYVSIAARLAGDLPRLAELRATMRENGRIADPGLCRLHASSGDRLSADVAPMVRRGPCRGHPVPRATTPVRPEA